MMRRFLMMLLSIGLSTSGMTAQKSAMEVVNAMSPGWNLGNTFEASSGQGALFNNKAGLKAETSWQGTKTTPELIDFVKAQGFRSVRIPCAWVLGHISEATQYTIDKDWMARVKEVVDYCIKADLYVVLNDHWDGGWLEEHIADTDQAKVTKNKEVLKAIWTQIAEAFKDYDQRLIFAGLNEPNTEDSPKATTIDNLLAYEQVFIDAVRAVGGKNNDRVLVVQGPSTNIDKTVKYASKFLGLNDPAKNLLAIEVHYYNPWQFWGMEKDESWGKVFYYWGKDNHLNGSLHNATWGEEDTMKEQLMAMKTNFVDKGMPVVIGEFGANWRNLSTLKSEDQAKHDASIRFHYYELHRLCKELGGMVPMTWDINYTNQGGVKGVMTLIDRKNLKIYCKPAMEGITEAYGKSSGISTVKIANPESKGIYNLRGQLVADDLSASLPSGIYIYQNEKLAIK